MISPDRERHSDHAIGSGDSVQAADEVGQVVQHGEVMLHHYDELVGVDQVPDGHGRVQSLLHIQVGGGLVEHEDVRILKCTYYEEFETI